MVTFPLSRKNYRTTSPDKDNVFVAMHDIVIQNPPPGKYIMNTKINGDVCIELKQTGVCQSEDHFSGKDYNLLYFGCVYWSTKSYDRRKKQKLGISHFEGSLYHKYPMFIFEQMKTEGMVLNQMNYVKHDAFQQYSGWCSPITLALIYDRNDVAEWLLKQGYKSMLPVEPLKFNDNNLKARIKMKLQIMENN